MGETGSLVPAGRPAGQPAPPDRRRHTPIQISRRAAIGVTVAGVLLLLLLLYLAPSVPIIVLGGAILAIVLSFPVRFLSQRMRRGFAVLLTLVLLLGAVVLAMGLLLPVLVTQIADLIGALPRFVEQAESSTRNLLRTLDQNGQLPVAPEEVLADGTRQLLARTQEFARTLLSGALGAVSGVFGWGIRLLGMLFVAIYLLLDAEKVKRGFVRLAPPRYKDDAEDLWRALSLSLSRYLSGLALLLAIQGVLSATGLWLLGVSYAFLLGAWVALTALVPNLGAWLGGIPAVTLALFVSPTTALLTLGLFVLIQQLESNFLTPRIQGEVVRVHPAAILLAVIGATEVFGLLGAVLAVPVLAMLRVLWDFFGERVVVRG